MNKEYVIAADVTCDMPLEYLQQNKIVLFDLHYTIGGNEYSQLGEGQISIKEFYDKMRADERTRTAQVTPEDAKEMLEPYARSGITVVAPIFSSGISGSVGSVALAARELKEIYPNWEVYVIDTLCASMGHGLLLDYVINNKNNGMSAKENAEWIEKNKLTFCHCFTVEHLKYLHRGGRISKATAIVGTILKIKPCLYADNNGKLTPASKQKGRKNALKWLVDTMEKLVNGKYSEKVFISHCDSEVEAQEVMDDICQRFSLDKKRTMINNIGPVVGSHSGPGTIALFFRAEKRY